MYDSKVPDRPDCSLKLFESDDYSKDNWSLEGIVYNECHVFNENEDLNYETFKISMGSPWSAYSNGYLEAVKQLIESVKKGDFASNTFGYPIFYLFNHYLELIMKEIIINGRRLIDNNNSFSTGHDLIRLWSECKDILLKMKFGDKYSDRSEYNNDLNTIGHFIKEISKDHTAQSFRYPVDKNGNAMLSDGSVQVFNIQNLSLVVDWISLMLDCIRDEIHEDLSFKLECEAEYAGEYYD